MLNYHIFSAYGLLIIARDGGKHDCTVVCVAAGPMRKFALGFSYLRWMRHIYTRTSSCEESLCKGKPVLPSHPCQPLGKGPECSIWSSSS